MRDVFTIIPDTDIADIENTAIASMSDNGHALISPSGGATWSSCVGSYIGIHEHRKTAPDNEASIEGTCAHFLLELSLLHWRDPTSIRNSDWQSDGVLLTQDQIKEADDWLHRIRNKPNTDEVIQCAIEHHRYIIETDFPPIMRMEIQKTYDLVKQYLIDGWTIVAEMKVKLKAILGHDQCDGTSDVVMYKGSDMIVLDLKYGIAIPVSPEQNMQMKLYAAGAIIEVFNSTGITINKLKLVISQSRINDGVWKEWDTSYSELHKWIFDFAKQASLRALYAIGHPDEVIPAWFSPSEKACTWCHRRQHCSPRRRKALARVRSLFETADSTPKIVTSLRPTPLRPEAISDAALKSILDDMPFIMAWFKDAEKEALIRTKRGSRIGRKMVEGRVKRDWNLKPNKIFAAFLAAGASPDQFMNSKVKSPAQIEAAAIPTDIKEKMMKYCRVTRGSDVLALDSDNRTEVTPLSKVLKVLAADEK